MFVRRITMIAASCLPLTAAVVSCGQDVAGPDSSKPAAYFAMVTFIVLDIESDVWRVDIAVNGKDIDPVLGSFTTDSADRVTMRIPAGDSLNAFARAFDGDTIIAYIGETYFDVKSDEAQDIPILLKFKGAHAPTP